MSNMVTIEDVAIWFKHVHEEKLRDRLTGLSDDETIHLEADGVVGTWKRLRTGKDGRKTHAIKPDGAMKQIWNEWFRTRKGENIRIKEATFADDYLRAGSALFSEWASPEDEEAFRDL